jgi:hypothetical protein
MLPYTTYTIPEPTVNKTSPNGKWLLFLTDREFSESQLDFVKKIGTALKASFESDAQTVFNTQQPDVSIQDILHSSTRLVISFGILPKDIGLWIDLETPGIRFLESFTFILTLPVAPLEQNANAKKELWKYMQMFMELKARQDG